MKEPSIQSAKLIDWLIPQDTRDTCFTSSKSDLLFSFVMFDCRFNNGNIWSLQITLSLVRKSQIVNRTRTIKTTFEIPSGEFRMRSHRWTNKNWHRWRETIQTFWYALNIVSIEILNHNHNRTDNRKKSDSFWTMNYMDLTWSYSYWSLCSWSQLQSDWYKVAVMTRKV